MLDIDNMHDVLGIAFNKVYRLLLYWQISNQLSFEYYGWYVSALFDLFLGYRPTTALRKLLY
jgi:hypothetical protein